MLNKEKWTWIVKSENGEKHIVELNNCEGKHKVLVDEILVGNMNPSKYVCHNYECTFMIDDSISCSIVALSIYAKGKQPLLSVNGKYVYTTAVGNIPTAYTPIPEKDPLGLMKIIINRLVLIFIVLSSCLYLLLKAPLVITLAEAGSAFLITYFCDYIYKYPFARSKLMHAILMIFWVISVVILLKWNVYIYQSLR